MLRDFEFYLSDIANAITDIQSFTAGITFEQYLTNRMVQRAVERSFEIIGEALKQAEQNFPGRLHSSPEFSLAIRFRDRLAHGFSP